MDHDQRFKELIRTFFGLFLQLFFKEWFDRLDTSAVEWIDKEVFPDPPEGSRRILDLVAKLPTRAAVTGSEYAEAEHWLALVHIEIESPDRAKPLRSRMHRSYVYLRDKYGLPVLPIAIFLRVKLDGVGIDVYEERFWEFRALQFQYLYVGLPGLDATKYVQGENLLGVALAALMKISPDQVAWLGAEALQRIGKARLNDQQRFLLGECVHAYLPLDDQQQLEFEKLLATESYSGASQMNVTPYEKGIAKGLLLGQRGNLMELLEEQCGKLPDQIVQRIESLSADEIKAITRRVVRAKSLQQLGLED
ncbi:DUF4351 domain-containing protein [soil metagenome]